MSLARKKTLINQYLVNDADVAERFRREQIEAINRLIPVMMAHHALVGCFVVWFLRDEASLLVLSSWFCSLFVVLLHNLDTWRKHRKGAPDIQSKNSVRLIVANAMALALVWGILAIAFFPSASAQHQFAIACVVISMMAIGAFSLVTIRQAALSYVSVFTICSVTALLLTGDGFYLAMSGLQGFWAVVVIIAILHHSFLFAERMVTRSIINQQGVVIDGLEKEITDILVTNRFEIDRNGMFKKVDKRTLRLLGKSLPELQKQPITALLETEPRLADHPAYLHPSRFRTIFDSDTQVKSRIICLNGAAGKLFWRISGRTATVTDDGAIGLRCLVQDATDDVNYLLDSRDGNLVNRRTGLPNRRAFEKKIYKLLSHNLKKRLDFACVVVHLENFADLVVDADERYRDTILKEVGTKLKKAGNGPCFVAHKSGNEFGLLCPLDQDPDDLLLNISKALNEGVLVADELLAVKAKIGCSVALLHGSTVSEVINAADQARKSIPNGYDVNWKIFQDSLVDDYTDAEMKKRA